MQFLEFFQITDVPTGGLTLPMSCSTQPSAVESLEIRCRLSSRSWNSRHLSSSFTSPPTSSLEGGRWIHLLHTGKRKAERRRACRSVPLKKLLIWICFLPQFQLFHSLYIPLELELDWVSRWSCCLFHRNRHIFFSKIFISQSFK